MPAAGQFLEGRHVHRPVVQELLDLGKPDAQKATIGADRVAAERDLAGLGDVFPEEGQRGGTGLLQRGGRGGDLVEEAAGGVHPADRVAHAGQHIGRLVDDEVGTLGDDLEVVVGDEGGDLDDDVVGRVESGHLEVHPSQHDIEPTCGTSADGGNHVAR